jgi:Flp pilus assembly protein TadD
MKAAEKSGNLEVALTTGSRELEIRPDNREARLLLSRLQTRAGLLDQANYTLEPLAGDQTAAYKLELARIFLAKGETQPANSLLNEVAQIKLSAEENRTTRKLQAISQDQSGNHSQAQELYNQLLIEQEESSVRHNYGQSLLASKNYTQAAAVLKPLLDLPQFTKSRVVAAAAMAKSNNSRGARDLLEGFLPESEINRLLRGSK